MSISLPSPPSLPSNPLSGISNKANGSITNTVSSINKTEPLKNVAGLKYEKAQIDCTTFPLSSLDKLPMPPLPDIPLPQLPSKQELTDRITQFIPTAPGIPSLPQVPSLNLPSSNLTSLPSIKIPEVPTLSALNPFPGYKEKVKLWLNEPITLPNIKDMLPNLPEIPKPPFFTLPCNQLPSTQNLGNVAGSVTNAASNPTSLIS
ncbi:MAG: hypothetical protein RL086_605 [Bacteroidota bacterium]|jgi:hypothetical protein